MFRLLTGLINLPLTDADSSCTGTGCVSYKNGTIIFSLDIDVNPGLSVLAFTIPITDISFLNPIVRMIHKNG